MTVDSNFHKTILDNIHAGVSYVDRSRIIRYWNKGAERLTGYRDSEVVGRSCSADVRMCVNDEGYSLCEGQCPLAKAIADGRVREEEVYLQHKDGHRKPVSLRIAPIRNSRDKIVGAVEVLNDNFVKFALDQRLQCFKKKALFDSLTGLANRRYIEMNLRSKLQEKYRYDAAFGVMFVALDEFKMVNDKYGRGVGDILLKTVSTTLVEYLRPFDILGRWGGDEFIAIILDVNKDRLYSIANRLCLVVEESSLLVEPNPIQVTVSIGATLAKLNDTVPTLVTRAHRLVHESKIHGGNHVSMKPNLAVSNRT